MPLVRGDEVARTFGDTEYAQCRLLASKEFSERANNLRAVLGNRRPRRGQPIAFKNFIPAHDFFCKLELLGSAREFDSVNIGYGLRRVFWK